MPAHADEQPPAVPPSLRQRRRTAATREILEAAERHITAHGPAALSLRAVARSLGMTVQALYHYFPSRDALVTTLITKAYDDLADAVQAAVDAAGDGSAEDDLPAGTGAGGTVAGGSALPRLVIAAEGYRRWAIAHPERFQLLYGTPLRDYVAPSEGSTTQASRRMSAIFEREMFGRFTPEQLAAADTPVLSPALHSYLDHLPHYGLGCLPPPATALFLSAWGHLHGLVTLEVFGQTAFLGDHQAELFRTAIRNLHDDIHRRIPGPEPRRLPDSSGLLR